jgi:ABC-type uncharacterized transport system permease subunit
VTVTGLLIFYYPRWGYLVTGVLVVTLLAFFPRFAANYYADNCHVVGMAFSTRVESGTFYLWKLFLGFLASIWNKDVNSSPYLCDRPPVFSNWPLAFASSPFWLFSNRSIWVYAVILWYSFCLVGLDWLVPTIPNLSNTVDEHFRGDNHAKNLTSW